MSPSVERTEVKVGDNPEQSQQFIIIRLNDPEVFDDGKFDGLVRDSMQSSLFGDWLLKYIVYGDTMYIFPSNLQHYNVALALKTSGVAGELQSAGDVWIPGEPGLKRKIDGYSTTLLGSLYQADSEAYKNTVIKEALGDFFQIE